MKALSAPRTSCQVGPHIGVRVRVRVRVGVRVGVRVRVRVRVRVGVRVRARGCGYGQLSWVSIWLEKLGRVRSMVRRL